MICYRVRAAYVRVLVMQYGFHMAPRGSSLRYGHYLLQDLQPPVVDEASEPFVKAWHFASAQWRQPPGETFSQDLLTASGESGSAWGRQYQVEMELPEGAVTLIDSLAEAKVEVEVARGDDRFRLVTGPLP